MKRILLPAFLTFVLISPAFASERQLRKGNRLYGKEEYVESLTQYSLASKDQPSDPRPVFNGGNALYRLSELDQAAQSFDSLTQPGLPVELRSGAHYNSGNARYQQDDYKAAARAYRSALILNPADEDARYNLALALRSQKKPPQQCPNPKQDKKDQGDKDKDKPRPEQGKTPDPATRPQDQMPGEDAERIMRAAAEKEKAVRSQMMQRSAAQKERPPVQEDW
ncbi:MAG: tetratricopeptide repeat protein [Elusimicrobia bacterium]|nr:tetratricopeptide repeat protein [Elusimicrobiota bacterium]